jgi:hypothetical protein
MMTSRLRKMLRMQSCGEVDRLPPKLTNELWCFCPEWTFILGAANDGSELS